MLPVPILLAPRTRKKTAKYNFWSIGRESSFFIAYWRRGHMGANILAQGPYGRQYIGAAFIPVLPVVPAFRSLQLSGRSDFPVVPAFRSFRLSGCSGFPVILAFQVISSLRKQNNLKKKRTEQFGAPCLFTQLSPIHWALLTGNGNIWNKRRRQN